VLIAFFYLFDADDPPLSARLLTKGSGGQYISDILWRICHYALAYFMSDMNDSGSNEAFMIYDILKFFP
jgi:hypothetical protein